MPFPCLTKSEDLRAGQLQGCCFPGKKLQFNLEMLLIPAVIAESAIVQFVLLSKQQEPLVPQEDFILEQPGQMQ